jgi:tricorn protease
MKTKLALAFLAVLVTGLTVTAKEVKLVRYPHYSQGRIVFTYLADIWTADEDGRNVKRITVHKARDVYPKFSPDG